MVSPGVKVPASKPEPAWDCAELFRGKAIVYSNLPKQISSFLHADEEMETQRGPGVHPDFVASECPAINYGVKAGHWCRGSGKSQPSDSFQEGTDQILALS